MPRERRRVSSSSSTSSTSSTTSSSSTSSYSTVASDPEITNSDPAITAVEPNSPNTVEVIFQRATTEHANDNQQTLPETPVNESSQQEQSVTKPVPPQLADAQNNTTTSSSSLKAGMDTASAIDERRSCETHTKEEKTEVVPHISKFEDNAQNDAKCTPQKVAPKTEQQPSMNPAAISDIQNQKSEPGKQNNEKRETISLTDVTDTGISCTDVATASNAKPNDQIPQQSTGNPTETTRSSDESSQQVTEADKNVETIGNELAPADTETCEMETVKNQVSVDPKEPDKRNIASESGTKSSISNVDPNGEVVSESTQRQVVDTENEEIGKENDQQNSTKSSDGTMKMISEGETELVKAAQIPKNEPPSVVTKEIAKTNELYELQKNETSNAVAATDSEKVEDTAERLLCSNEEISGKGLKNDEITAIEGEFESMGKIIDEIKKIEHEANEIISKSEAETIQETRKLSEENEGETAECVAVKEGEVDEVVAKDGAVEEEVFKNKQGDTKDATTASNGEIQTTTTNSIEPIGDIANVAADGNEEEAHANVVHDKMMNETLSVRHEDGTVVGQFQCNEITNGKTSKIVDNEIAETMRNDGDRGQQNDEGLAAQQIPDHKPVNEKIVGHIEKHEILSEYASDTIAKVQQNEAILYVSSQLDSAPQEPIPSIPSNVVRVTDDELNSQKDEKMEHDNTEKITSPKREIEGVVTGEPPVETISKVTSALAPTTIDSQCKVGAVENSAVDRLIEETKNQPLESNADISAPPGHRSALDSVSNVENMTQLIPELAPQMHASTSEGLNDQKPALPADHQPTIEGEKSADQVVQKNENAEHKQSNEIRGSEGEHALDKLQNVALNKAQEQPKVDSEESAKMSVESGKPPESALEKADQKDTINNSLRDSKIEPVSSDDEEFVDAISGGSKEDALESNKPPGQDPDKLFRGQEGDSTGIQESESQPEQASPKSTDQINSAIKDTGEMADRNDIPMEISFAIEDHPNDPNDGAIDQPTSHSLSEMDISMDAQSSEGTEPKADTAPELVFELGKEPSEDHEQPEAEAKLVEAVAEEPTFHEAKEAGQLTQIGGSTYETPVKKTAAPTIDSRTITRPSKKGQALPEATVAPVAKVDSQPQTTAATQMAAAAADIPTVPPVQHLQQKPQQPQSKAVPVASQGVPVVSAVTSSTASSAAATVSATAEPQPSVPPSTAHPTQPTPKAPAQPQQQSQQQRPQVHQRPPQQQQQQSQVVTAAPVKTSSAAPHGDANAVAAVKAVEQAKKEDPRSSSHRVRQRTVTVHSQFAIDVATAFHEIKQMGLDDPLTEAQRRIQAVIAMKEKEWAARFEKMGQVLAHEQKKSDVLEQKASERLLLVGEQEACIKKLVEQLKRISQKGVQNGMQMGRLCGGPGPERTLSPDDVAMLMKERDQLAEDVNSLETSYGELFRRYEKLRQTSIDIKNNEDRAKKQSEEMAQRYALLIEKFDMLRKNAEDQLDLANNEIDRMMKQHEDDTLTLRLRVKQLETKVESLNVNLEAKQREMDEMTNIFEEVINKAENNS